MAAASGAASPPPDAAPFDHGQRSRNGSSGSLRNGSGGSAPGSRRVSIGSLTQRGGGGSSGSLSGGAAGGAEDQGGSCHGADEAASSATFPGLSGLRTALLTTAPTPYY